MLYIKVEGIGKVQKDLTGFSRKIPVAGRAGLWNFTQHLAKMLREEAPMGATGHMKSTKGTRAEKVNKNEYIIKMPFYTKYLESGTKPHPISFKSRKLRWWSNTKGINFYSLRASIFEKGTKPHPFTAKVIMNETKKLKDIVGKKINNSMKRTSIAR